jgi:glycosyltransferase involved in cell wall biosynthesis
MARKDSALGDINTRSLAKKKVLLVAPWPALWSLGKGRGGRDDVEFLNALKDGGFSVTYLLPCGEEKRDEIEESDDLSFIQLPAVFSEPLVVSKAIDRLRELLFYLFFNVMAALKGAALIRRERFDIVISHSAICAPSVAFLSVLFDVPSVVKLFGVMYLNRRKGDAFRHFILNLESIAAFHLKVDRLIALDDGTEADKVAERYEIDPERFRFLPNAVSVEWFGNVPERVEARSTVSLPDGYVLIIHVSRFDKLKRVDRLVAAMPDVLGSTENKCKLVLVGDGEEMSNLRSQVQSLDIKDDVVFTGSVPQKEIKTYLAASDIFASTSDMTNANIPTCEAMICGLPVVAADAGSTSKVVLDGETGLLVPVGDQHALSRALIELVDNPAQRKRMGEAGAAFAREHFVGYTDRMKMELDIYDELLREE